MQTKNKIKMGAMIIFVLFIAQIGASATRPSFTKVSDKLDDGIGGKKYKMVNDTYFIDLDGSIKANLFNGSGGILTGIVYPTIDMPGEQNLDINTTQDNESWVVNATLRIQIDKSDVTNKTYLIPRCLTVFAIVMRKNTPLISGVLRDLFLGRLFTRVNVFNPNSSDYVEIPLMYSTKNQDEEQRVFILAIGSLVGFFMKSPPLIVLKTIDLSCHYSANEGDIIPPVTTINLSGNILYGTTYEGKVMVSFQSSDEVLVDHTSYQYVYSNGGTVEISDWTLYNQPYVFDTIGSYDINYYSVDSAGNIETEKTASFSIASA